MAHVIIADGDYGVLYLLKHLLQTLGWTYDAATEGIEAWHRVQQSAPDLVMAGFELTGMNGLDLLVAIKSDPRLANIKVVLMSAPENEAAARAAGCDAFVTKPFGGQTILRLLPQILSEGTSN
jgi:CheY-like chemotaxis protein